MRAVDPIDTGIGSAWLDDRGLVWHEIETGAGVNAASAADAARAIRELTEDRSIPAIVDLRGVAWADIDARTAFSGPSIPNEPATALIVAPGISQLLADLFVKFEEPRRPIALFESEPEAVAWAERYLPSPEGDDEG